jgi:zinc transport system permease protein
MEQIIELFGYQFVRNAFFASAFASIIAGFIGTYIVSRKIVFISDGITHASFGGIGIAYFLGLNPFMGAVIFGIASALGIEWVSSRSSVREDSAIAILWSLGMAVGIIFIFLTPGYAPNLMSFLFGSILNVTLFEVAMLAALALVVAIIFLVFYRPILYAAFDPEFATAAGLPVKLIRYFMLSLIALSVVVSIKIAGIILVMSLFTIPQVIANLFVRDFRKMIPLSMLFALLGMMGGLVASYFADLPSGATIIFFMVMMWGTVKLTLMIVKKVNMFALAGK